MLLLLLACARSVAPALEIDPADAAATAPEPTDPAALVGWMVAEDPLVRRPRVPTGPVDGPLAAFRDLAVAEAAKPTDWADLEARHRGTVAVPFARGARLAALETSLGDPAAAMPWVLPLPSDGPAEGQVRPVLDWLGTDDTEALLPIVERQVILGWLDGPAVPVDAAARALGEPTYDRIAATPAGKLLLARAARPTDPAAAATARAALEEATWLAAMSAAADRDAEQATLKTIVAEARAKTGTEGSPTRALLASAADGFAKDAGTDASVGYALLSQAALRWDGGCPDQPCGGFDRVAAMEAATRWDPGIAPFVAVWRAIASKDALDRLEAAYDAPSFPKALDAQVEVLLGTGGSLDRSVLLYPRPGPPVQLALSRAAGGGDLTSREDLLHTLRARLAGLAKAAASTAPDRVREPLLRMAKRAEQPTTTGTGTGR